MNELFLLGLLASSLHIVPPAVAQDTTRIAAADSIAADSVGSPMLSRSATGIASGPRLKPLFDGSMPLGVIRADFSNSTDSADSAQQRRPRAIEYSEWYGHRLTLHRLGSYAMLPLFAGEYWLGNKMINDLQPASWLRPAHGTVASALGILFTANTVTGVWNLWDSRHDPSDRTRRTIHSALMLAADAAMLWTASLVEDEEGSTVRQSSQRHKNAALVSIGIGTLGTVMMWVWKN